MDYYTNAVGETPKILALALSSRYINISLKELLYGISNQKENVAKVLCPKTLQW